jgi:hypothetical protein
VGPRAVGADVDDRVEELATELAVTQDDAADTALGQCSEDARRPLDAETRHEGSEDAETRRRQEQTSNPNELLILRGQDVAPVAHALEAADAAHGAIDIAATWLIEGFVLGIVAYLDALLVAVLAIAVALAIAAGGGRSFWWNATAVAGVTPSLGSCALGLLHEFGQKA